MWVGKFTEILNGVQNLIKESRGAGIKFMRVCMCILKHLTPDWFTNPFDSYDLSVFQAVFP